jgi:hypothetical protein
MLVAALMGLVMARSLGHWGTSLMGSIPPSQWLGGWLKLGQSVGTVFDARYLIALGALAAAGLAAALGRRSWTDLAGPLALAAGALGSWLFVATRAHVALNGFDSRYVHGSMMLVQATSAAMAAAALPWLARVGRAWVPAASGLVLAGVALWMFGLPSPGEARQSLEVLGRLTPALEEHRVTHLSGRYWDVWPAVFHANLVRWERGDHTTKLYGLAHRAGATRALWEAIPREQVRLGVLRDEEGEGERWRKEYGYGRARKLAELPQFDLYDLSEALPSEAQGLLRR